MKITVLGAGSLGSLVGGLLAREHSVTLVGREPHVTAVREDGLSITGAIETTVRPHAATEPPEGADLAVVAVKAYDTAGAAEALADAGPAAALSLQNGLENEATLADALACPVLAGTCSYGARLTGPGTVACTGVGTVALGPREGGQSALADDVGAAFTAAGIETAVADDMPRRRWEKLAVNAGINPVTALAGVENGALADGEAAELAHDAAREVARVARAEDIDLSEAQAVAALESVVDATAANRSSMLQDVDAGRRTEIDAISGAVLDRADETTVDVPVMRTLATLVRTWERGQGLR